MIDIPPTLRQRLARTRLVAGDAIARGGVGDRRSASKGEGIEFEDHRQYQFGDDFRRLDPHLSARLGSPHVRQFNVTQQLNVTIVIDASRSMAAGRPSKLEYAVAVARCLAHVGLSGSDAVQAAVLNEDGVRWHRPVSGVGRLGELEQWLTNWSPSGGSDLQGAVHAIRERLKLRSLTFLLSDFWSDSALASMDALAAAGQSVVAVQVLAPDELDPTPLVGGQLRLMDMETSDEVEVAIGQNEVARYRELLAAWTEQLRQRVLGARGRFITVSSDTPLDEMFMRVLPAAGVLV